MAATASEPKTWLARISLLNTFELLEKIILGLPFGDVLKAASKVNKTWHNVVTSSIEIDKHFISSRLFATALRDRRVKRRNITLIPFVWATVIIKRLEHTELICIVDRFADNSSFASRFLPSFDVLHGLTTADQKHLTQGWRKALGSWSSTLGGEEFFTRFEFALWKCVDPNYGGKAQVLYEGLKRRGVERRHRRHDLSQIWKMRETSGHDIWKNELRLAMRYITR